MLWNRSSAWVSGIGEPMPPVNRNTTEIVILRGNAMRLQRFRTAVVCAGFAAWWAATTPILPGAAAEPGYLPAPLGPQSGQSCNDPLKLAYDSSGQAVVCTRAGTWAQSVMPSTVRLLGTPCSPYDPVAKTPDDHLIGCPSGLWALYHP
jgi:hypothetical protein